MTSVARSKEAEIITGRTSLRVRYPETDQMGVVHHSHYLVWFEIGRTELMRDAGFAYSDMEKAGVRMPVIEAHCRYLRPARYDETLTVETRLDTVRRASVRFEYRVERASDGTLVATGSTRHAATDADGVPRRLPDRFISLFAPS